MLHYEDLPPLVGTPDEIERGRIVRFACLHTIQNTQRALLQEVSRGKRSVHTYHRQTAALQITMSLHTQASWWVMPFPYVEQDFRATWGRIMAAPYRVIDGFPRFIFSEQEQDFAHILAPLAPHLIYQEIRCVHCGLMVVRSCQRSLWEPVWCGCCIATEVLPPLSERLLHSLKEVVQARARVLA